VSGRLGSETREEAGSDGQAEQTELGGGPGATERQGRAVLHDIQEPSHSHGMLGNGGRLQETGRRENLATR
jgi:hypothetical protein